MRISRVIFMSTLSLISLKGGFAYADIHPFIPVAGIHTHVTHNTLTQNHPLLPARLAAESSPRLAPFIESAMLTSCLPEEAKRHIRVASVCFITNTGPALGRSLATAGEAVRTTAGRITNNATARIITNGTRGRRNASARQVSNMPATARAMPGEAGIPAAWAAANYTPDNAPETKGKWCLPSAGVIRSIYSEDYKINSGLSKAGGELLPSSSDYNYYEWSSSARSQYSAWVWYRAPEKFETNTNGNRGNYHVRPVILF